MDSTIIYFLILLFIVATLYSSVGHGGASGYLALMGLFHFTPETMRSSALVLNILVSMVAAWQHSRTEKLDRKLFLFLIAGSVPAAFCGSMITIDAKFYQQLLGILIIFHSLRLMGFISSRTLKAGTPNYYVVLFFGVVIGLISGIIGIGGGIVLSPLLLMFGWANIKQTALISAFFIFLNSIAGIIGLTIPGVSFEPVLYLWIVVAFAGALLGSWLGSQKLSSLRLRQVLGLVLLLAGTKLIFI